MLVRRWYAAWFVTEAGAKGVGCPGQNAGGGLLNQDGGVVSSSGRACNSN